ncbi:MAG: hypothetical protein GDA45_05835 [Chromatiales bacterium]|nr:hypothetical protein [Chromatiales bacterium]
MLEVQCIRYITTLCRREHYALHPVLTMGGRLHTCVKQPLVQCRSCGRQAVCYLQWLQAGKYIAWDADSSSINPR